MKRSHKGDEAKLPSILTDSVTRISAREVWTWLGGQYSTGAGSYHYFPRETVKSSSSGLFKTYMDKATANLI